MSALALPARRGAALFALLLAVLALIAPARAQTFPALTGRVVDAAHLLSADQVAQLDQLSAQVEQASTRQLVVATIPDLQGYPIEDYGYRLGREWKIGQGEANNGIVLIVAPAERKVRIEVGYGLEPVMTDALSHTIIDETILPKFRGGDMAGGIVAGAQAIAEQLKLPLEAAEQRAKAATDARKSNGRGEAAVGGFMSIFWLMVVGFIILRIVARRGGRGRRYRRGVAPVILWGPGFGGGSDSGWGSSGGSSWGGFSGGGGGGFSGGGGSFGGGGASGSW